MLGDGVDEAERVDRLVAEMIGEALLAGAYAATIRQAPETAGGFGKLAARHQARVAALAEEIRASVRSLQGSEALAVVPVTRRA